MSSDALLEVRNLSTHFRTSEGILRAVDAVSLEVRAGETVGIVGESGSGKSVTARSIMRLIATPSGYIASGSIEFEGRDLLSLNEIEMQRIRGARISMVFQDPMTFLNPIMTVGAQVAEVIRLHRRLRGKHLENNVIDALRQARVPTPETLTHFYPHQLSGGMRQRVLIAIAMACSPALLIADEPTTALDVTIQAQILRILKNIVRRDNTALLLITHDLGVIAGMCDRVYVMYAGQIVEEADVVTLFERPKHPYTQGLLRSVTPKPKSADRFPSIEGHVPNLLSPPSGCRFHPRCPQSMPICREKDPMVMLADPRRIGAACWLYREK
jgi:oligopeptide/dipeptide ABC transporter ATP-binding protein